MNEKEILEELKKLAGEIPKHNHIIANGKHYGYDAVEQAKARLEYIAERTKFLNGKLQALRLQRGIFRTR